MSHNRFQNPSYDRTDTPQKPQRTILDFGSEENESNSSVREALLRESRHLTTSEQLLDEQFEVAVKTRETLLNQRWTIKSMQTQYNNITNQFQSIGALIKRIKVRKQRDTIILAVVFCICLGLLLYYIF